MVKHEQRLSKVSKNFCELSKGLQSTLLKTYDDLQILQKTSNNFSRILKTLKEFLKLLNASKSFSNFRKIFKLLVNTSITSKDF